MVLMLTVAADAKDKEPAKSEPPAGAKLFVAPSPQGGDIAQTGGSDSVGQNGGKSRQISVEEAPKPLPSPEKVAKGEELAIPTPQVTSEPKIIKAGEAEKPAPQPEAAPAPAPKLVAAPEAKPAANTPSYVVVYSSPSYDEGYYDDGYVGYGSYDVGYSSYGGYDNCE
jgi:hypothetical protein